MGPQQIMPSILLASFESNTFPFYDRIGRVFVCGLVVCVCTCVKLRLKNTFVGFPPGICVTAEHTTYCRAVQFKRSISGLPFTIQYLPIEKKIAVGPISLIKSYTRYMETRFFFAITYCTTGLGSSKEIRKVDFCAEQVGQ